MKTKLLLAIGLALPLGLVRAATVGYVVGFDTHEADITTGPTNTTLFDPPLYAPWDAQVSGTEQPGWWGNLIEEAAFTNLQYMAMSVDGDGTTFTNFRSATRLPALVTALNDRGYNGLVNVALFDDTSPYPNTRNQDRAASSLSPNSFDMSNSSDIYTYWWLGKWYPFFSNIPSADLQKVGGRPLVFIWLMDSGLGFSYSSGDLPNAIDQLRTLCQNTFSFDPYIVVDKSWIDIDANVIGHVDGVDNWYNNGNMGNAYTNYTLVGGYSGSNVSVGVCVPGYWSPGNTFIDRNSGSTFDGALSSIMGDNIVLIEDQTDTYENVGVYRGASDVSSPFSYSGSPFYGALPSGQRASWPNQYLNILRTHTAPNPHNETFQVEGCDEFYTSLSISPSGQNFRRAQNLNIYPNNANGDNWSVDLTSGDWVQYDEFQLGGSSSYIIGITYSATSAATAELDIDGSYAATVSLSSTGSFGTYAQSTSGTFSISSGYHTITLKITSGEAYIDSFWLNG